LAAAERAADIADLRSAITRHEQQVHQVTRDSEAASKSTYETEAKLEYLKCKQTTI